MWAYFSVSAIWRCFLPAPDNTCDKHSLTSEGLKAISIGNPLSYSEKPTNTISLGTSGLKVTLLGVTKPIFINP